MFDPMTTTLTQLDRPRPVAVAHGIEGNAMLLHEALARARMQEAELAARQRALVRTATAGRRWARLARFADRRAALARSGAVPHGRDSRVVVSGLRGAV